MNHEDSLACHRCFRDKALIDFIRKQGKRGWCDWCGGRNVYVVPLYELGYIFRDAVSIYEQDDTCSDSISFLLQEDWGVFSDKVEQDPDLMQELTVAILKAGLSEKDYFTDYPNYDEGFRREESWLEDHWHYKAEAYYEGRGTPYGLDGLADNNEDDIYSDFPDQLEAAFEDLSNYYEPGKVLYRARIHDDRYRTEGFSLTELVAPPSNRARAGRANRKGEPVLYLANDPAAALAEVRAWKGTAVAIAKMKIKQKLSIISLLTYEVPKSPFFVELVRWKVQLAQLFDRLAYELSMPVISGEDEKIYFSTQYLCDWVKKAEYDGIEYPSAMGNGFNVVIFNPDYVEPINLQYVRVKGIQHNFQNLNTNVPIYEEGPFDYLLRK